MTNDGLVDGFRRQFIHLVRKVCRHDAVSYAEAVASESSALRVLMSIGDADVRVTHAHEQSPHIDLEFEFGSLPEGRVRAALLHLLELNGGLDQQGGAGFGVDADGSTVIFRERIHLAATDSDSMLILIRARGDESAIWFETWHPELFSVVTSEESEPERVDPS